MKISKLFHTLYGCLMALPIFVIPIFAININQKSVEPISIEVQENKEINFNQLFATANKDIHITTYYSTLTINTTFIGGNKYMFKYDFTGGTAAGTYNRISLNDGTTSVLNTTNETIFSFNENKDILYATFYAGSGNTDADYKNVQLFNLTQMYGAGNEPSISLFNQTFTASYYNFTLSQNVLINDMVITYNDTDIGSQFLYSIYKPVNDYFNFKDFMGLGSLYDWIQLNIFSGSNSLVFFILFNFFTYWIFVSFFWLIFDVLMYVPSLVHKMLDKARME